MTGLTELLAEVLPTTTFQTSEGANYSGEELRQAFTQAPCNAHVLRNLLTAPPQVDDVRLGPAVDLLRSRLTRYLDVGSDRIGHSFEVTGGMSDRITTTSSLAVETHANSTLSGFAKGLIRAAAVLGPDRAAQALSLWASGEPRQHKICVVLDGVTVGREIEFKEGLRLYPLPSSSDSLPSSMPDMLWVQAGRVLGRTLLEIDASTRPALFVPTAESCVQLQTRTALGDVTPDTFLLALSLVCNQRVSLAWGWNDHGDASAFSTGGSGTLLGTGTRTVSGWSRDPSTGITKLASKVPPPNLDETGLQRAWALRRELQKRIGSDQRFQIAVDRWARAATPGDLKPDRLIDLRIALEALYVDSDQGELGFRLSVTGARHLRTSLNERRAVKKKLTQFYRLASKTIHAGTSSKDVALVGDVTTLCRDGILKMVEERNQPDWTDVLLS